jgi:predicted MFS family arabinose efflux permease
VQSDAANFRLLRDRAKEHVRRRDLFRRRDFRVAMLGQTSSQVADAMTSLGLAQVLLFDLNPGDTTQAFLRGLVLAAIPLLLVGPLAGYLADKYSRQAILRNGQRVRATITLGAIIAAVTQSTFVGYLTFGALLLATRVLYTARVTVIPRLVEGHQLVAADSTSLILSMTAGFAGVAAAGALEHFDVRYVFIVAILLHALSSRFYSSIVVELGGGRGAARERDWKAAAAQTRHHKVRFSIVSSGAGKLLLGICYACVALVIDARFAVEATGYAAVFGVAGAGTFAGTLSAEWVIERVPRKTVAVLASIVSATAVVSVAILPNFFTALGAIVVASFAFQNVRVCNDAAVQSTVHTASLGRVFAVYDVVYNLSFVLGAALGLSLGLSRGFNSVLLMCAAGYAVLSVGLVILGSGETRRDPAAMLPEVGPASAGVSGIATATPVMLASVDQPARAS